MTPLEPAVTNRIHRAPSPVAPSATSGAGQQSAAPVDFVRAIVEEDLRSGKHETVVTRFPPEPNGHLHIGHAKAICLDFGVAREHGGRVHLRFDDTNPAKEEVEFVEGIKADVRWLGFEWDALFNASDYFERMYAYAEQLIEQGDAYVDSLSEAEIREYRGTVTEAGRPSPHRERSVEENLALLRGMRAGDYADGEHVLRAKIDMAHPNMKMRDPPFYRIRKAHHHRTGDEWPIYPLYDYAHCVSDSIEGITHSLCTKEFENNRELYDWFLERLGVYQPQQIEFARLALTYTVMSKRKLRQLVEEGRVSGWDDPRMPTLAGLRRLGYPAAAIRAFIAKVGVAKADSLVDVGLLENAVRDELNHSAPRAMAVLDPLKVVVESFEDGVVDSLDVPRFPSGVGDESTRVVPFTRELFIERADFAEEPPKGWKRLAPGVEVRLRGAWLVRCERVIKDDAGNVIELRCSHDPASRGGVAPDGRKVRGTIHWVSATESIRGEVRLYDRLFRVERPGMGDGDFLDELNPDSLEVLTTARLEPSLASARPGDAVQLERVGYFTVDGGSAPGALVLNRTVTLRDSWAKDADAGKSSSSSSSSSSSPSSSSSSPSAPAADVLARQAALQEAHGLSEPDALALAANRDAAALFNETVVAGASPDTAAKLVLNELPRALRSAGESAESSIAGAQLAQLAALVDGNSLSTGLMRDVLGALLRDGGDVAAIAKSVKANQVGDEDSLGPVVDGVIAANPAEAERFRAGEAKLMGFFVGQVMRASRGKADPKLTRKLLQAALGG